MDLHFITKAASAMDIKARLSDVHTLSEQTGYSRFHILTDMVRCALQYGAGPADYRLFELYSKTPRQRKSYVTRGINNQMVKKWNDADYCLCIDDKVQFHRNFSEFTRREYLPLEGITLETLKAFTAGKDRILYKPAREGCGRGIAPIIPGQWAPEKLLTYLKEKPDGLLEEMVIQHSLLHRINPASVNTVRMVTLRDGEKCVPIFAFLRMGTGGKVVDNLNSAGIAAKIELKDGTIRTPAAGKDGTRYTTHPDTGAEIMGFTIPHWDQVLRATEEASAVIPQVRYVGWDVAVRENDVLLIEGNSYPGHDILQLPAYTPNGYGLKPILEPYL